MSTYNYWRSDQGNLQALSEELAAQATMARSREASLNRRLRSLEGDLSSRVEVLTGLVNALVELGEVREELALFTPARRAREAARALTRAVVTGEGDVSHLRRSPDLVDVPGYWLVPAALAVADVASGGVDADAAQEALQRDRRRAATYLVAVCTLVGRPALVSAWVASVLDAPVLPAAGWGSPDGAPQEPATAPRPATGRAAAGRAAGRSTSARSTGESPREVRVTAAERALWLATAEGLVDDGARDVVRAGLADRLALLDDPARSRLRAHLLDAAPALPGADGGWGTPAEPDGAGADTLGVLRAWVGWSRAVAAGTVAVPTTTAEPGPVPPRRTAGVGTGAGADDPVTARGTLLRVVGSLVDEGAPVERDLLDRAELLGERVGRAPAEDGPEWDATTGTLVDLLVDDARGSDAGRAALVAPLLADELRAAGHARAAEVAATPVPSRTLRLAGRTVTVTPAADGATLAATGRAELLARPVDGVSWGAVGGTGAVAGLGLVLGIAVAPAWYVVALVAGIAAGWQWFSGERRARAQRDDQQHRAEQFDRDLATARAAVAAEDERAATRREAVATVVAALDDELAALGSGTPA